MIDETLRTSGSPFATNRFNRYRGTVEWKFHSEYYSLDIYRAYHADNGKPCALYAVNVENCVLLVGENLDIIKKRVREVKE